MSRVQHLENLTPNKSYSVHATLKYGHRGPTSFTGILQQDNSQSKICIRHPQMVLGQGYDYNFQKCFFSSNGWLYARKPQQTIERNGMGNNQQALQLKDVFQHRSQMQDHYISVNLFLVKVHQQKKFQKGGQQLTLDKLTCFGNGVLIDVQLWNKTISKNLQGRWLVFEGVRLKATGPDSMVLNSSVYSKVTLIQPKMGYEQYNSNKQYKNLSSFYQVRPLADLLSLVQANPKIYSQVQGKITHIKQCNYEGCSKCKKKVIEGKCPEQCADHTVQLYNYLNVQISDDDSIIWATIFDLDTQKGLKEWNGQSPCIFTMLIKSTLRNTNEIPVSSHILNKIIGTRTL